MYVCYPPKPQPAMYRHQEVYVVCAAVCKKVVWVLTNQQKKLHLKNLYQVYEYN